MSDAKMQKLGSKGYVGTLQDRSKAFYVATTSQATALGYWKSLAPSATGTVQDIKRAAIILSGISAAGRSLPEMELLYWKSLA